MTQLPSLAIGCDHADYELKNRIRDDLTAKGYSVIDCGTHSSDSVDYPDYAKKVCDEISASNATLGILICGSGIGISIAANRNKNIRCALCHNTTTAQLSRQHNDANIIALGARIIDADTALACVDTFLTTEFEGGRHQKRIDKMS